MGLAVYRTGIEARSKLMLVLVKVRKSCQSSWVKRVKSKVTAAAAAAAAAGRVQWERERERERQRELERERVRKRKRAICLRLPGSLVWGLWAKLNEGCLPLQQLFSDYYSSSNSVVVVTVRLFLRWLSEVQDAKSKLCQ